VLLAERKAHVFPLLYALLPSKRRQAYCDLFQTMAQKWPTLQPQSLSVDFEVAAFQEVQAAFPNAQLFRCLLHLTRNMKKKLTEEQLTRRYNSDADFALQARMIVSVAFVPVDSIDDALETLADDRAVSASIFDQCWTGLKIITSADLTATARGALRYSRSACGMCTSAHSTGRTGRITTRR